MTKTSASPACLHGVDKDYTFLCCSHVYVSALETVYKYNYFFVYLRTLSLVHIIWRRISTLWRISKEVLCALSRHLLVGSELNQETPCWDSRCHGCDMNHASPECDSETLSLIPVALSARTVKVSLNNPKINYYPPTHVSVCQVVQFIRFYNQNRVCTSVTTRYGMLLLLLMLSNGQQVLTASWLPAWLGRLTDIFMVTTEGRWRALTTAASDSGKRRNIADLGKWNVSLTGLKRHI